MAEFKEIARLIGRYDSGHGWHVAYANEDLSKLDPQHLTTREHLLKPKPGDRFHEMYTFFCNVVFVDGETVVTEEFGGTWQKFKSYRNGYRGPEVDKFRTRDNTWASVDLARRVLSELKVHNSIKEFHDRFTYDTKGDLKHGYWVSYLDSDGEYHHIGKRLLDESVFWKSGDDEDI